MLENFVLPKVQSDSQPGPAIEVLWPKNWLGPPPSLGIAFDHICKLWPNFLRSIVDIYVM